VEGIKALAEHKSLQMLIMADNHVDDEGAEMLAKSESITHLNMGMNKIGDKGAKALAKSKSITKLDIHSNLVGEAGIKALMENSMFTYLNVSLNVESKGISNELEKMWNEKAKEVKEHAHLVSLLSRGDFLGFRSLGIPSELEKLIVDYYRPVPFRLEDGF
jgi:hypothetical protein